jgi:hypothetical protein
MRFLPVLRICVLGAAVCLCGKGQTAPAKDAQAEAKGMPPRATPADYQSHAQAGTLTIAAEFSGHSVPTEQGPLSTEDYVVIEMGLFGPSGARAQISTDDFALRINGKKTPVPSSPYGSVFPSLKDPEWVPPDAGESKSSKTSLGGGGQSDPSAAPPVPAKMPFPLRRAMNLKVQKAALPEGDRPLPVAGLIFFQYRGQAKGIQSVELIYSGPAGKATLALQP